jgi:archaeosine-15-forming tRNA-guanine transglycosylase
MAMKADEMEILRAVSAKLDDDTIFIMTYQYHVEKDSSDPEGKRTLKSASRYRMIGRVEKIKDLEERMISLRSMDNRLNPWMWPDDPNWDKKILYSKDSSNMGRSNWIRLKINKAISWDNALNLMKGFKKDTDKSSETFGQYVVRNPSSVYDLKDYTCSNGDIINIDDKDALLAHVGQNIYKEIKMKTITSKY